MKKVTSKLNSIFKLRENFSFSKYSKQTISGLFRSLTETLLEIEEGSLILYKVNQNDYKGLLQRIEFSKVEAFAYENSVIKENFLIAMSDRFAFALVWDDTQDFANCIVSINHNQVSSIINLLQEVEPNEKLEEIYLKLRYDRRENKIFSSVLTKLLGSFEELQKDFMCQDTISNSDTYQKFDLMASKVTHEGRNYLGLIDLHASLINKKLTIDKFEKEALVKSSKIISKSIDNLDNLFDNIKFYEESFKVNRRENNLYSLLKEIKELFLLKLEESNIALNIDSEEIIFEFDYSALKQVLVNLIKNSIEAISTNGEIKISTSINNDIEIYIEDSAGGIDEELKETLFELNVSSKQRSSGIGLNLSKELIEKHDGSIEVVKTSKEGTTFLIKLPK